MRMALQANVFFCIFQLAVSYLEDTQRIMLKICKAALR